MHTPPIGVTFKFSMLHLKKYIYTMFVIIRLVRYVCKRTDCKEQLYYANSLHIKALMQKLFLLKIAKFMSNPADGAYC